MSQIQYPDFDEHQAAEYGTKFPVRALTARVLTLASLIVSVAVVQTYDVTLDNGYVVTYKDFRSYKYMFYTSVIGVVYTLLQIPFAIYYMRTKKHLVNSFHFLKFSFYADKVVTFLLATGAGAAFGSTLDLKQIQWNDKRQDFLTMGYVPSTFLLVGGIACAVSSVHSSLALTKTA